jgi:hypothetical protein
VSYILLYRGATSPSGASHEGWPELFNGHAVRADGALSNRTADLNGYSLVRADYLEAVLELVREHPFLRASNENSIEIFEIPRQNA